ncbi:hypothetical protein BDR05DRAFT_1006459 [Suillus weaverae]|nr:hypothetical protein BDR05DRAFT_1006459 [Suillus weaverae]
MPGLEPLSAPSLVKAPAPSLTLLLALFLQCLLHHIPFLVKAPAPPAFWKHLTSNETLQLTLLLHHPIPPDGAADFSALIRPRGGASPSTNLPGPQLPPQNHQPLPPDPQLPLWSPPDTSAQRAPPSTLHPPPSQHPPHFSGTGGSPIDNPDGDLDDDPHADNNDPFFAPLGNTLSMLGGGTLTWTMTTGWSLTPPIVMSSALIVPPGRWDRSGHTRLPLLPLPWKKTPTFSHGSPRRRHTTVVRCLALLPSPLLVTLVHLHNCGMGPSAHLLFGG